MNNAIKFERTSTLGRIKTMLKADIRRLFTSPLLYIMVGACLAMPILILVMTSMMGGESIDPVTGEVRVMETFENVWQIIGALPSKGDASGEQMSMGLTTMCNIDLVCVLIAVPVCIFVADDFRSGFAKNIFCIRSQKVSYVISKTVIGFIYGAFMILAFFIGALLGGAISALPFDMVGFNAGNVIFCILSKVFITLIFSSLFVLMGVIGKQKLWLSMLIALGTSTFLFMIIPIVSPLTSTPLHALLSLLGGGLFAVGLGAISNIILKKTNLV